MSNPKAKFFCEYCDTEVPQKAIVCPKCGHFFASVRCPQCGHTGTQSEFSNGCNFFQKFAQGNAGDIQDLGDFGLGISLFIEIVEGF